jgi:hypothetical protein
VTAHEGSFVISRDDATPPRLYVNGPCNLLDGSECIGLIQGDDVLKGSWFNDAPQFQTLQVARSGPPATRAVNR